MISESSQRSGVRVVAILAGSSGGHLFPAFAVTEALRRIYPDVKFVLVSSRRAAAFVSSSGSGIFRDVLYLPEFPAPRGISLKTLGFLLKLALAFWQSFVFLRKYQPSLCIGFGSYASFPGTVLARKMKIPVLIHEQNVAAGRATAKLAPYSDLILTSFPGNVCPQAKVKHIHVGLPIRPELRVAALQKTAQNQRANSDGKFHILVAGGSQGSEALNRSFLSMLGLLSTPEKAQIAVKHIAGKTGFESVREAYSKLGIDAEVFPFFEKMSDLYSWADWAVSRAGANSLFELAAFQIPALVVPYPFAGGHQAENAAYFEKAGAVEVCAEKDLNAEILLTALREVLNHPVKLEAMREAQRRLAVLDAADAAADVVKNILG